MGCANTKAGGAAVAEEQEGAESQQKDMPKVTVDGEDMAVNGNTNGIEEGTKSEEKEAACNGDLAESKRKSKAEEEESSSKNGEATTPSGGNTLNGGAGEEDDVKMADAGETNAQDGAAEEETSRDGED